MGKAIDTDIIRVDASEPPYIPPQYPDRRCGDTDYWADYPDFVPGEGEFIVYSDYHQVEVEGVLVDVPGIKIGDGVSTISELPFITAYEDAHLDDSSIFWATYGETTYGEIMQAGSQEKKVCCKYNSNIYDLVFAGSYCLFACTDNIVSPAIVRFLSVETSDSWSSTDTGALATAASIVVERGSGVNSVQQKGTGAVASGRYAVAVGNNTVALADYSHTEGAGSVANGNESHAEGANTTTKGEASHAEGFSSNKCSNPDGTDAQLITAWSTNKFSIAKGVGAHAEGRNTLALSAATHAEGYETIAEGSYGSHAEGRLTHAKKSSSHAEGVGTETTNESEHAEGKYNVSIQNKTQHTVGIGTADNTRKNAHVITTDGKHYILGVGGYTGEENTAALLNSRQDIATVINSKVEGVFIALEEHTPFTDIKAAIDAGREVLCSSAAGYAYLAEVYSRHISFVALPNAGYNGASRKLTVDNNNNWTISYFFFDLQYDTVNKKFKKTYGDSYIDVVTAVKIVEDGVATANLISQEDFNAIFD